MFSRIEKENIKNMSIIVQLKVQIKSTLKNSKYSMIEHFWEHKYIDQTINDDFLQILQKFLNATLNKFLYNDCKFFSVTSNNF